MWRICYWSAPEDQVLPVQISNHCDCSEWQDATTWLQKTEWWPWNHRIWRGHVKVYVRVSSVYFTSYSFTSLARQWPWNAMQLQRLFKPISRIQCRRVTTLLADNCFFVSRTVPKSKVKKVRDKMHHRWWLEIILQTHNDELFLIAPTCYINEIHKVTSYKAARQ
jgi:hypothetical protein